MLYLPSGLRLAFKVIVAGVLLGLGFLLTQTEAFEQRSISTKNISSAPYSELYQRSDWKHWIDLDGDCQNTRAEVLIARSTVAVTFRNSKQCSVIAGSWFDPYSGKVWTKASDLDIDHVVPLKWAHGHGGQYWSKKQKQLFANDWENLLIVHDKLNHAKGAKSPDDWMPPNFAYRCEYVKAFDQIVSKYQLAYIASEKRVIQRMLAKCG